MYWLLDKAFKTIEARQALFEASGMKPQPTESSTFVDKPLLERRRRLTTPLAAVSYRLLQSKLRWYILPTIGFINPKNSFTTAASRPSIGWETRLIFSKKYINQEAKYIFPSVIYVFLSKKYIFLSPIYVFLREKYVFPFPICVNQSLIHTSLQTPSFILLLRSQGAEDGGVNGRRNVGACARVLFGFEGAFEGAAQLFFGHGFLHAVAAVDGDDGDVVVKFFADRQVVVNVDALDPEVEFAMQGVQQVRGVVAQVATGTPIQTDVKRLRQVEHVGRAGVPDGAIGSG